MGSLLLLLVQSRSKVYSWKTLRVLARENLHIFSQTVANGGDLEVAARMLYTDEVPPPAAAPSALPKPSNLTAGKPGVCYRPRLRLVCWCGGEELILAGLDAARLWAFPELRSSRCCNMQVYRRARQQIQQRPLTPPLSTRRRHLQQRTLEQQQQGSRQRQQQQQQQQGRGRQQQQ